MQEDAPGDDEALDREEAEGALAAAAALLGCNAGRLAVLLLVRRGARTPVVLRTSGPLLTRVTVNHQVPGEGGLVTRLSGLRCDWLARELFTGVRSHPGAPCRVTMMDVGVIHKACCAGFCRCTAGWSAS